MDYEMIANVPSLSPRDPGANKGEFGRVLIVGGSRGMIGALALAANAALRGGAGLVTIAVPEVIQLVAATLCPCALSVPLACDDRGEPQPQAVPQMLTATKYDVLAIGPGMGRGGGQINLVRAALEQDKPLVIDADGLNNLAQIEHWPERLRCPCVLTPHPGEFSRLTGVPITETQSNRVEHAVNAVRQWMNTSATSQTGKLPLVLVLKGEGTVVTDGQRVYVNTTGNPGMATGGTGDVLTGLTAALMGQGLSPFDAAVLAVYVHGKVGDLAAAKLGQVSMIASDLIDFLPDAFAR